jgi:putative spermidine/putrescine transport system substrate-binding protein
LSRRAFVAGTVGAIAFAGAIAKSFPASAQQGLKGKTIRLLTWSDATGQAAVKNIAQTFESATGAKVIADLTGATSEMVAKIKASAARPQYDMVILSGVGAIELARAGLLEKPDLSMIPNASKVFPEYRLGAEGYGVGYFLWNDGLIYSTRAFSSAPSSFAELWDEKHSGKIYLPPPQVTMAMELVIIASELAGADMRNPGPGFKMLEKLRPRLLTLGGRAPQLAELFRAGSLNIGGPYSPLLMTSYIKNPDYGVSATLNLKEGFFSDLQFMVVLKGHQGERDAIYGLINHALDAKVQATMAEEVWYGPINQETVLSADVLKNPYIVTPELIRTKGRQVDWEYLATVRPEWTRRYTEALSG